MKLTVLSVKEETSSSVVVRFKPEHLVSFKPGQFFMLLASIDGRKMRRAYSVASSPTEDVIEMAIQLSDNPTFSKYAQSLKKGDTLLAEGPLGKFVFDDDVSSAVFIGAGSGIAPLMCMMRYACTIRQRIRLRLLYSSKTKDSMMYREEIKNNKSVDSRFFFTEEGDRRISDTDLKKVLDKTSRYFLCGPPRFVSEIQKKLIESGIEPIKIKTEKYS